jgi:ribosomal protein L11 methyltransferase
MERICMSNNIEINIPVSEQWQKDIVIAQLSELGFEGFEEERSMVKAYIQEAMFNEADCSNVLLALDLVYTKNVVAQRNWNAEWESTFDPVIVESFCAIRAGFHKPVSGMKHEIIITPKMSFGTGHHATTYMMIAAMSEMDISSKAVFDFGTGTGVLAILAKQMGAGSVTAIDNDDWSIDNAIENFAGNQCTNILLRKADMIIENQLFDIILANINLNVIIAQMAAIAQHLPKNGVVLFSGLLKTDKDKVMLQATENGLKLTNKWEKNDWICLKMNKL